MALCYGEMYSKNGKSQCYGGVKGDLGNRFVALC